PGFPDHFPTNHSFLNIGYGQDPTVMQFVPAGTPKTSVQWGSLSNWLPLATPNSEILIFTSPHSPGFFSSSVASGALTANGANQSLDPALAGLTKIASPFPEPGTLAAFGAAAALALISRRRRVKL